MPTKSDPKFNARVAVEVMGWKPEKRCHENWDFPQFCSRSPECQECEHWYADDPDPYDTDISAAWEVMEKIRPESGWVEVKLLGADEACCYIWDYVDGDNGKQYDQVAYAAAPTAPLAICRAALAATEKTE